MKSDADKRKAAVDALLEIPFRIDTIDQVPAPDGSDAIWQRYVITQGANTIVGLRAGARSDAVPHIEDMVARLNERRMGKLRPRTR